MSDSPLSELRGKRRITVRLDAGLAPALGRHAAVVIGNDPHGAELQVLIAEWSDAGEVPIQALRELHKWRLGKKAFPLVTVIRRPEEVRPGGASIAPTSGERGAVEPRTVNEPGGIMNLAGAARPPMQPSLLTDRDDQEPTVVQRWLGGRKGATGEQRGALVMGPDADVRPVWLPEDQVTRMLRATLDEPSAPSAQERIVGLLKQAGETRTADRPQSGIDNSGLFSRHYLLRSLPGEERWAPAQDRSRPLLSSRGTDLIRGLGFRTGESLDQAIVLMGEGGDHRAVAVLLERTETFDAANRRLGMSPAAYGLDKATKLGADWLILLRGAQIRLYATRPGTGVGSRSPVETWFQLDLAAIAPENAGYLDLVFSAAALGAEGGVDDLLARSRQFAADLGGRLRQRVYERVVPGLAVGVAEALDRRGGDGLATDLACAYRLSLRILFRLLFQAYAEDHGLLPYGRNDRFDSHSLKRLATTLSDEAGPRFDPSALTLWRDLQTIWRAIDKGDEGLGIPPYNGGLFAEDPEVEEQGADLAGLELADDCIGPALRYLLVDETPDGDVGPVDFRSLSVREFGTIYEGLLESEISRAETNLTTNRKGAYLPARPKDEVVVPAGDVYFHNRSGERKATGSYFTPEFAVEHLLDHALEPALKEHLERVAGLHDQGDQAGAAEAFWDFHVADISMGSGHFLVAAIDRIERGMRGFLADRPLPSVNDELARLARKAREALGADTHTAPEIEQTSLLRRQIARRCIHGVDLNETAVELARVAVWIHTFVPGLPMSTLDHNLICGDSLTGIGTVDEALKELDPSSEGRQLGVFSGKINDALEGAAATFRDLAATHEADIKEVSKSRRAIEEARLRSRPAKDLLDAAVAARLNLANFRGALDPEGMAAIVSCREVREQLDHLNLAHMPVRFPEVFTRSRPGFDVLLGNPPWEKAKVEEHGWWAARSPGLRSLRQAERSARIGELHEDHPDLLAAYEAAVKTNDRLRRTLLAGPYPGTGTGDPDLYHAFCWRFWQLARDGGAVGVVLPRSALSARGSAAWRKAVLKDGAFTDLTLLLNKRRWAFSAIHPQYSVGLVSIRKDAGDPQDLQLRGPYDSRVAFDAGVQAPGASVPVREFLTWNDTASIPSLPSEQALRVFRRIRSHPRLELNTQSSSRSTMRPSNGTDGRTARRAGPCHRAAA